MSCPSLTVVRFGQTQVHFRRHNGGYPETLGPQLLDMLESAEAVKPRAFFHTGSYLLRFMFQAGYGDEPISPKQFDVLPMFEAIALDDDVLGDWEFAYEVSCDPAGNWTIAYVEGCNGEPWSELVASARKFTPEEFREFVEGRFQAGGSNHDD